MGRTTDLTALYMHLPPAADREGTVLASLTDRDARRPILERTVGADLFQLQRKSLSDFGLGTIGGQLALAAAQAKEPRVLCGFSEHPKGWGAAVVTEVNGVAEPATREVGVLRVEQLGGLIQRRTGTAIAVDGGAEP